MAKGGLQDAAAKHAAKESSALSTLGGMDVTPQDLTTYGVTNPAKFLHNIKKGKGPAIGRLNMLRAVSKPYEQGQTQLGTQLSADLPAAEAAIGAQVNEQTNVDPMVGQMQDYVSKVLGVGLSPEQESAMRAELRGPVESGYQQAVTSEGQSEAASGIAPGSGVARARGQQLQQQREQGLSGVENEIVGANLQRIQEGEQLGAGQASLEEQQQQGDVANQQRQEALQLQRLGQAEGGMAGLASLSEGQREFDVTETEAQRQAKLARDAWAKFGASMQPSGLETASGAIGGLLGGLGA